MASARIDIRTLQQFPTSQVRKVWGEVLGRPVSRFLGREFLLAMVAWHQQAEACGGLSRRTQAALRQRNPSQPSRQKVRPLPVGTVLLKTYQGTRYTVTVQADGLVFEGTVYASLSEIARRITGTRWNGPAFFGLRRAPSTPNPKDSA